MPSIELLCIIVVMIDIIHSEVSIQDQVEHVLRRRLESQGLSKNVIENDVRNLRRQGADYTYLRDILLAKRRYNFAFDQNEGNGIIGVPSRVSHLPEAEPILPGHTLIRPAFGMLKSSIKFPHKELDNGAGVNGNINSLGLKYDGRNERVLYSGFRRNSPRSHVTNGKWNFSPYFDGQRGLSDYILVASSKKNAKPRYSLTNVVLDMDKGDEAKEKVLDRLELMRQPVENSEKLIMILADPKRRPQHLKDLLKMKNSVIKI